MTPVAFHQHQGINCIIERFPDGAYLLRTREPIGIDKRRLLADAAMGVTYQMREKDAFGLRLSDCWTRFSGGSDCAKQLRSLGFPIPNHD